MIKPDYILAASAYVSALPALVAARRIGIPFVYEVRGLWEVTRYSARPELHDGPLVQTEKMLETHIVRHADAVLTLTGGMRDELALRGVDPQKITIVPNSCNPENFAPAAPDAALRTELGIPEGVATIGYIGTFVQYEGLDDLVLACSQLAKNGLDFRLLLVGSENTASLEKGPIRKKVESIAQAHGIEDKLVMPGRVPHEKVAALYSLIDIAPFPRKPQPVTEMVSPMKPLEALAMEKAVVVSSVQALAEMVEHEETGLVFEKGDVSALAETLQRLIADPALRKRLGKAGRAWVQRERSWDRTADKAAQILLTLATPESESDGL